DSFNFSLHSEHYGVSQSYRVLPHKALGENVHFITKPSKQYDSGKLTLVDGQSGSRPWKGHEWIGFDTCNVSLEVSLAKKRYIKDLNISYMNRVVGYTPQKKLLFFGRKKLKTQGPLFLYLQDKN
ncbi:MAG: hypothetical protein ACKN86_12655, partial [Crocinitomicaceae bacterium]